MNKPRAKPTREAASRRRSLLTREEIRAALAEPPDEIKRMEGRAGRRPKWRAGEVWPEIYVATAVEIERLARGIPTTRVRTPDFVFDFVAGRRGIGRRTVERFFAKHRDEARYWARLFTVTLPKRRKAYRELVERYGERVGAMPTTWVDRVHRARAALPPSKIPAFDDQVRSIIGEKPAKTG